MEMLSSKMENLANGFPGQKKSGNPGINQKPKAFFTIFLEDAIRLAVNFCIDN